MIGVEFYQKSDNNIAQKVTKHGFEEGLLLLACSVYDTVRFIPPLNVSASEIETGLKLFEKALEKSVL